MVEPTVILKPKTPEVGALIKLCDEGKLPFSGPDSLCSKIAAMGYKTTSCFEMVVATREEMGLCDSDQ